MLRYLYCVGLAFTFIAQIPGQNVFAQHGGKSFHIEEAQQRFFDHWQSARTFALAGAAIPVAGEVTSLLGNPAGLAAVKGIEAEVSYDYNQTGAKNETSEYQHVGIGLISLPLVNFSPDWGTVGIGWSGMQGGPRDFPLNSEHRTKNLHVGYGWAPSDEFNLGYALTWANNEVYSNLFNYDMSNGFRHSLGIQHKYGDTSFGLVAFYGHGKYDADLLNSEPQSSSVDQYGLDLGGSIKFNGLCIFIGFEYLEYLSEGGFEEASADFIFGGDENGTVFNPKLGVEFALNDRLTARAGTRYLFRRHSFNRSELKDLSGTADSFAWSIGLGAILPLKFSPRLDAAVEQRHLNTGSNRQAIISILVPFSA